jgi:hypothetical protein
MKQNDNAPLGSQSILCNVKSCRHNKTGASCELDAISVAACSNGNTGKPQDESMCASYEVH